MIFKFIYHKNNGIKFMSRIGSLTVGELLSEIGEKIEGCYVTVNRIKATKDTMIEDGDRVIVVSSKIRAIPCGGPWTKDLQ